MSETVKCLFLKGKNAGDDRIELGEAAQKFDDQFCGPCWNYSTCKVMSPIKEDDYVSKNEDFLK